MGILCGGIHIIFFSFFCYLSTVNIEYVVSFILLIEISAWASVFGDLLCYLIISYKLYNENGCNIYNFHATYCIQAYIWSPWIRKERKETRCWFRLQQNDCIDKLYWAWDNQTKGNENGKDTTRPSSIQPIECIQWWL